VKQLVEKARAGKLAPNEFQGGTFRQYIKSWDVPRIEKAAAFTKMSLTLSADHRVSDGQVGGSGNFFTELTSNFSDIQRLLL
ncbi:hypothetical protein EJB05_45298, partial [Eragrostis curvula]